MAIDLMGYSRMNDRVEINEAATDSLHSMEALVLTLGNQSSSPSPSQLHCYTAMADNTVRKFKKFIGALDRVGHARFRRAPVQPQPIEESSPPPQMPAPLAFAPPPPPPSFPPLSLTLDFTKPIPGAPAGVIAGAGKFADETFSISPPISGNSSFLSSITADGSVSNGMGTSSLFLNRTVSTGRPPLSSSAKKKCHSSASGSRCHCSNKKKDRLRRAIRVPAISSKIADIPTDSYSWRKYGQKPIKGSPHQSPYDCRAYYKCSTVRGCPAKKHVERASDDFKMLVVTYEDEHRHVQHAVAGADGIAGADADAIVFEA